MCACVLSRLPNELKNVFTILCYDIVILSDGVHPGLLVHTDSSRQAHFVVRSVINVLIIVIIISSIVTKYLIFTFFMRFHPNCRKTLL